MFIPISNVSSKKYFNTRENKYLYLSAAFSAISATIGIQEVIYGDVILLIFILLWCIIEKYKFKEIITLAIKWVILFIGFFAYSLLPSLSVMSEYSAYGSSDTSYDFFSSYSLHPIKLIQMFVPEFFGDHNLAFGVYNSSEMDIELYLGLFVVALSIYGIFYLKKNNWIKVDFVCGGIALLYSCIAHIPYLNHLAYKIPVIGSFRCSGRMLNESNLQLVLIGGGQIEIPADIKSAVHDLGFVDLQDKYDAYAAAEVLCQPSTHESFSLVIMESWLMNRPVLVHEKCEVTKNFVKQANGGLYFGNYFEYEGCLKYLLDNKDAAEDMGSEGKRFVIHNFSWKAILEKYHTFFKIIEN